VTIPTNWKIQAAAFVIAICAMTLLHNPLSFLCGSPEGGLVGAILAGVGIFAFICLRAQGSTIEHFHPPAALYELSTIKALAAIKNGLTTKYFGERCWRFETLDQEEGTAFFVCKYMEKKSEKDTMQEKIILLHVKVERVKNAAGVCLKYDPVSAGVLEKVAPAEFCKETTEYIEQELNAAVEKMKT
jgi:hypothetical protein